MLKHPYKMGLSDREINQAIHEDEFKITPRLSRLNPSGIDLRIEKSLTLEPHTQKLAASLERVELSTGLLGILHIRSSLAREGLFASLALVDPGFQGQLTISLYNAGDRQVNLHRHERFIQLSLFRLSKPATQSYNGKYQNSRGVVKSMREKKSDNRRMESIIQDQRQ